MRDGPPDEVLSGASGWRVQVASWLDGSLLNGDVPISGGNLTADRGQEVPEKLTITVPRYSVVNRARFDWLPGEDPAHPLARFGQELTVQILVASAVNGEEWDTACGRFIIQSWSEADDGSIQVEAAGTLQRISDDRITTPTSPGTGSTLVSEFQRLLPDGFTVEFDPALVDRACPKSMEWTDSRIGALYDITDAWPARLRTDAAGVIQVLAPLPDVPVPVLTWKDGERGTLVSAPRADTRDRKYNRIVARSDDADDPEATVIQGIVDQTEGPMAIPGPYGVVTRFYASPLLTTVAQAKQAAQTMLAAYQLPSRSVPVQIAPDPRIELEDPVQVITEDGQAWKGYITAYDMPLVIGDGEMSVTVGIGTDQDEEDGE